MMLTYLIAFLASTTPNNSQRCDLLELNHCYHQCGEELRFTQIIVWQWSPDYRRYDPIRWKVVGNDERVVKRGGLYRVDFNGLVVESFRLVETWTPYDPEYRARRRMMGL